MDSEPTTTNLGLNLAHPVADDYPAEWPPIMDDNLVTLDAAVAALQTRAVPTAINYTAVAGDFVLVDTTSGPITITIPTAAANASAAITVKKISNDANLVTLARSGSDLLEFDTTITFDARGIAVDLRSDGVSAWVLN